MMLLEMLLEAARRRPGAEAVRDPTRTLTFRQLKTLAVALRGVVLRETQRDCVGIMLPATAAFNGAFFGALWAGKIAVPLNFLLSGDELGAIIADADLELVLTTRHFEKLAAGLPARKVYLEDLPLKRLVLTAIFRKTPRPPESDPDDLAVLLYTSGTTGVCKGVELTGRSLKSNCDAIIEAAELRETDRFLGVLPPFHVFGLTGNVLVPTAGCFPAAMIPRFSPAAVWRAIEEFRPTVLMAVPSMYAALLRSSGPRPDALKGFHLLISGGEPLPGAVADGFRERFGVELLEGYGLTETSPVISMSTPRYHRQGSVGKPLRNVEVRIVDPDGGAAPPGKGGEIVVRGPGVMRGYHHRPEETAAVLDADGWFRTGDIGTLDAEGHVHITGRLKEMLIVGGENVFPREIETVLAQHAQVAEVAVIGVPDASRGEIPIAFVTVAAGGSVSEMDLRRFAREKLGGHKVPREILIVDELPRGPTGKVLKGRLKELRASAE